MSFLKLLAHYSTSPVGCWCAFLWTLFVLIRQLLAPHLIARETQRIWKKKRRKQKGLHKGGGETGKKINARRDTRKKSWNHILYTCFITLSFYVLYPHLVVFLAGHKISQIACYLALDYPYSVCCIIHFNSRFRIAISECDDLQAQRCREVCCPFSL